MARRTDAELVALARRDAPLGWASIWDVHGDALHSYCLRMLDDRAEADDAVADVFLVASQRISQLREPDALRAWLYAIARRRIQQRWRSRDRTTPVDPQSEVVMNRSNEDTTVGEHGDAAELLAAASEGLSVADRELLALALGADLDTAEVARITGESTNAISVRVTRLKETVGRAAGALLVARHHRRDCETLDAILAQWDGDFDTVWRKRIARHVDQCDVCEDRRQAAVAVFAAPLLLAPTAGLRDRVLERISATGPLHLEVDSSAPDLGPYDRDGFPAVGHWSKSLPVWWRWVAASLVLLALAVGGSMAIGSDDTSVAVVAPSPTTETPAPTTTAATTTTTVPADGAPATSEVPVGVPDPTTTSSTTTPRVVNPPTTAPRPTISIQVTPATLTVEAGSPQSAQATITVTGGTPAVSTTINWDGPDAGSVVVAGAGSQSASIGPFTATTTGSGSPQTITVTATTTDAQGRTATASTTFELIVVTPG